MVNTYQHISFAQLVYFSYFCGEALLATNTYQMRSFFCSAEIYLWSCLCLGNIRPLPFLLPLKLTLFPPVLFSQGDIFDGCASKSRSTLTHFWIHKGCQVWERSHDGRTVVLRKRRQSRHWFKDSVAQGKSLPHSFLGAPCDGNPGGAAPGGKPIRPDWPMRPAYNAAYDVAAAEFAADAESPAADAAWK